jgi:hypothetical protein
LLTYRSADLISDDNNHVSQSILPEVLDLLAEDANLDTALLSQVTKVSTQLRVFRILRTLKMVSFGYANKDAGLRLLTQLESFTDCTIQQSEDYRDDYSTSVSG